MNYLHSRGYLIDHIISFKHYHFECLLAAIRHDQELHPLIQVKNHLEQVFLTFKVLLVVPIHQKLKKVYGVHVSRLVILKLNVIEGGI